MKELYLMFWMSWRPQKKEIRRPKFTDLSWSVGLLRRKIQETKPRSYSFDVHFRAVPIPERDLEVILDLLCLAISCFPSKQRSQENAASKHLLTS